MMTMMTEGDDDRVDQRVPRAGQRVARVACLPTDGRSAAGVGRGRVLGRRLPRRHRRGGARTARRVPGLAPGEAGRRIRRDRGLRRSGAGSASARATTRRSRNSRRSSTCRATTRSISVTSKLIAPTIEEFGTPEQRAAVVPDVLPARGVLLSAVLRTRRRERPRRTGVQGRPRRRRMGARRPEGVDVDRPDLADTGSPSAEPTPTCPSTLG